MSSDAKEYIRDKLQCRPAGAVALAQPCESAAIFPKPGVRWSKMCTGQPSFVYLLAFTFLSVVFIDFLPRFCFLDKAGVFVGSSVVQPPVFPFFCLCLPCPFFLFLFCFLFVFSPFFSSFFCCIYYEFILAEDLCVHFPLLLISLSFSGGFLVKEVFFPLFFKIFALGARVSKCISESFDQSGYIPCRIGKDGGFIRRDRSFHLPRINLAKARRCVTDTLSKKFMSVWVSTG